MYVPWNTRTAFDPHYPRESWKGEDVVKIFGLMDPRDQTIRYIGCADPVRIEAIAFDPRPCAIKWFAELAKLEMKPRLVRLGSCRAATWNKSFLRYLKFFGDRGDLLNRQPVKGNAEPANTGLACTRCKGSIHSELTAQRSGHELICLLCQRGALRA